MAENNRGRHGALTEHTAFGRPAQEATDENLATETRFGGPVSTAISRSIRPIKFFYRRE
jgi:hypothetical protein